MKAMIVFEAPEYLSDRDMTRLHDALISRKDELTANPVILRGGMTARVFYVPDSYMIAVLQPHELMEWIELCQRLKIPLTESPVPDNV
jgi:hypothetical protein